LIIFEDEVGDLGLLKKLRARLVVQMLPPHRYDGVLTVEDSLRFEGKELLTGERFSLKIPLDSIAEMHLGFDELYIGKDSKGKKYQLNPIRIRFRRNGAVKTMYAFMEYNGLFRSSSGEECFKILSKLVKA
jgi:hypothetical protein